MTQWLRSACLRMLFKENHVREAFFFLYNQLFEFFGDNCLSNSLNAIVLQMCNFPSVSFGLSLLIETVVSRLCWPPASLAGTDQRLNRQSDPIPAPNQLEFTSQGRGQAAQHPKGCSVLFLVEDSPVATLALRVSRNHIPLVPEEGEQPSQTTTQCCCAGIHTGDRLPAQLPAAVPHWELFFCFIPK